MRLRKRPRRVREARPRWYTLDIPQYLDEVRGMSTEAVDAELARIDIPGAVSLVDEQGGEVAVVRRSGAVTVVD